MPCDEFARVVVDDAHVLAILRDDRVEGVAVAGVERPGGGIVPRRDRVVPLLDVVEHAVVGGHLRVFTARPGRLSVVHVESVADYPRDERRIHHRRVGSALGIARDRSTGLIQLPLPNQASGWHHGGGRPPRGLEFPVRGVGGIRQAAADVQ